MNDIQDKVISEREAAENTMDEEEFIEFLITCAVIVLVTVILGAIIFGTFYTVRYRPADPVPLADIEEVTSVTALRDYDDGQGLLLPDFLGAAFERFQEEMDHAVRLEVNIFEGIEDPKNDAIRFIGYDLQDNPKCQFLDVTPEQAGAVAVIDEETGLTLLPPTIHEQLAVFPLNGQEICNELERMAQEAGFIG